MIGRAHGRARGRAAAPPGEALQGSPSPPGSERASPKDEDSGGGNGDAVRGRASYRPGLLVTKPEGKQSQAIDAVGQETGLFANYFKIRTSATRVLSDYRVDFEPNVELRKTRRMMVATQAEVFGNAYVFDGMHNLKSIYDAPKFHQVSIRNEATSEPVKITFKRTGEINWFDEEMLRFLNMQLRRNFEKLKYLLIFRHYFDPSQTTEMPNYDLRIMRGLATAIARHDSGLMMVCDTVSKVVHSKTVMDWMTNIRKGHPQDFANVVRQKIPCQIVMTTYNNRTYKISDVDFTKTAESTFKRRGVQISYIDYYRNQYSVTVSIPRQPLLVVNPTSRDIRFATHHGRPAPTPIYLLPEFCVITGLTEDQQADQTLKRTMTQTTQVDPIGRFQSLKDFSGKLQGNPEVQGSLKQWDITYAPMPLQIKGRILPSEYVYMDGDMSWQRPIAFNSEKASFEREMRSKKMFDPSDAAEVRDWVIFVSRRNESDAQDFAQMLNRVSGPLGMKLSKPILEVLQDDRPSAYGAALQSKVVSNCQLVVCIVPNNDKVRYDLIKRFCYTQKGVASQVIVGRTLSKKQQLMSVCTKVGIQVATKLGAAPWSFKIPPKNLMVIGFDTYHDGTRRGESVGALIASLNGSLTRYYSRVTYHKSKDEMSAGVANLIRGALKQYWEVNGMLPSTIIFYRDGVGDGMIRHVYDVEVKAITEVLKDLAGDQGIRFTFCIVTKRINTRFLRKLTPPQLANPLPGTVVDSDITRPERYEFFCVSQSVRAGTVSPTNYNIIHDTTSFKPQNQQQLVYKLTHLYFNWMGTIRVPAPCQYAHKLAYLTGTSLHQEPSAAMGNNLFYL